MLCQFLNQQSNRRHAGALAIVTLAAALLGTACTPEHGPGWLDPPPITPRLAETGLYPGTGAQSWIEYPVEAQTLPVGLVSFVVYASDPRSIVQTDLRINGQALPPGQPRGLDADGGYRLARLDQTWQPPAEGEYIVEARARNSAGEYGAPTYVKFCVGSCKTTPTPAPRLTGTPTPAPYPTGTPTPAAYPGVPPSITPTTTPTRTPTTTPTHTPTTTPTRTPTTPAAPPPPPPASINFRSDAPYVNGGSCTTLRWDVDNVQAVFLDGQAVTGHGTKQVCPCQQTTYTLRVVKRDNTAEDRQVTIMVYGACPAPKPPTTAVPPPPQDRTGPSISGVGLRREGCQFYGYATINDPSGVSRATLQISRNGGSFGGVWMKNVGGNNYETEVGISIGTSSVKIDYYVEANDTLNNQSKSGTRTENFSGCGY